jgi:hypothetical protein
MATIPMTPKNFGPMAKAFGGKKDVILRETQASFAVLATPKVGQWAIRYQRQDHPYKDDQGMNIPHIEVVIIGMRDNTSNQYYAKYEANSAKMPDCFSTDGITPDDRVDPNTKQNPICAGCPQKKPGSAFTTEGKPTKACRDTRKLAVIPHFQLMSGEYNEYGGGMLYTVTPTSLKNFNNYMKLHLPSIGHTSFSVATRMIFDPDSKWQKIIFRPFQALSEDEAARVNEIQKDPRIAVILGQDAAGAGEEGEDDEPIAATPLQPKSPPSAVATPVPPPEEMKNYTKEPILPPSVKTKSEEVKAPPPPRVGGFPATPKTVAEAVSQPAPRPTSQRTIQQPEPDEPEEVLDESDDGLGGELDNELKRLLAGE